MQNLAAQRFLEKALGKRRLKRLPEHVVDQMERNVLKAMATRDGSAAKIQRFNRGRIDLLDRDAASEIRRKARRYQYVASARSLAPYLGIGRGFPAAPARTGLALSGGGVMGSFQTGVLAYLDKIWPEHGYDVVTGTSVGAVNAIALAESGRQGIPKLVRLWMGLLRDEDMYTLTSEAEQINALLNSYFGGMTIDDLVTGNEMRLGGSLERAWNEIRNAFLVESLAFGGPSVGGVLLGVGVGGPLGLMVGLTGFGFGIATGVEISNLVANVMARVNAGESIMELLGEMEGYRDFAPLRQILNDELDTTQLGQRDKPELRLAMVCLEDGETYYMTEDLNLLQGHADQAQATVWPLRGTRKRRAVAGVIASSAVPVFFPPEPIALRPGANAETRHFVDGGVRELTPYLAAKQLDCEQVLSVVTIPEGPGDWFDVARNVASIAGRSLALMLAEIDKTDIQEDDHNLVIRPEIAVFADAFNIDPGLIRINVAYGYMRAYDRLSLADSGADEWSRVRANQMAYEITTLRLEIWRLEQRLLAPIPVAVLGPDGVFKQQLVNVSSPAVLNEIRALKREVFDATCERYEACSRDRDSIPISIEGQNGVGTIHIVDWWTTWERHKQPLESQLAAQDPWSPAVISASSPAPILEAALVREQGPVDPPPENLPWDGE